MRFSARALSGSRAAQFVAVAFSHSSIQALRFFSTSAGLIRNVLAGTTSLPKASGSGWEGADTGIIQLLVGMMSWKAGETMNLRKARARSLFGDAFIRPATSIWM